jgi:hypothetical protein
MVLHRILPLLLLSCTVWAQQPVFRENVRLVWADAPERITAGGAPHERLRFEGAHWDDERPGMPMWVRGFPLPASGSLEAQLEEARYEPVPNGYALPPFARVGGECFLSSTALTVRREHLGRVRLCPLRLNPQTGQLERLTEGRITVVLRPAETPAPFMGRQPTTSVLADGQLFKLAVSQDGMYKIDHAFLQGLGVDMANLDPRRIQLFGNGGAMLPESNAAPRAEDLVENAVWVSGQDDGRFDNGDYLLFYAEGPDHWFWDATNALYRRQVNYYDRENYYFLKIGSATGLRIAPRASLGGETYTTEAFDAYAQHEKEEINILDVAFNQPASGKIWYGEKFLEFATVQNLSFSFPNRLAAEPVRAYATFAVRSIGTASGFRLRVGGGTPISANVPTAVNYVYSKYAYEGTLLGNFTAPAGNSVPVEMTFLPTASGAEGWLNYVALNTRARLDLTGHGGQLLFRDRSSAGYTVTAYRIQNAAAATVWDVTDPTAAVRQETALVGGTLQFGADAAVGVREFVAFDGSAFLQPRAVGPVANQNLHALTTVPDMVVVYHPAFEAQGQAFADYRANQRGISVQTVSTEAIFNEFASGKADPTAIRDFCRMLYERDNNARFRYLLLFGDASFDYKNNKIPASENSNFVPTWQTLLSTEPTGSYNTDDYFAFLDPNEGGVANSGMDIAVGRFPVSTVAQAQETLDKLIAYESDPERLSDWKNRLSFIADDEDNNLHLNDADPIAQNVATNYPRYNVNKIYLDAYPQVSTTGGNRYPGVQRDILANIFRGTFILNYMGHGGEDGITEERVFTNSDINSLTNRQLLPLFITATCTFAPFDDPQIGASAGELLFLNPDGGAIALMSTTRVVYANANEALTNEVFERIFDFVPGQEPPSIGRVILESKEYSGADASNSRKFVLMGDPSMILPYPRYEVATVSINGRPIGQQDTLRALQRVTVDGYIRDFDGSPLTTFNGTVYPTVFDKVSTLRTRGNDAGSIPRNFFLQKNILYKGRATVTNGYFQFSFVVPKDIDYTFGNGKISYYAEAGIGREAAGHYSSIVVGGSDSNAVADNQGPLVEVFMNDEQFAFGGTTNADPTLFVKLSDENGINTTGASIGHDITGVLDDNNQQTYVLNDFYQAALDDYTRGELRYPLSRLEDGRHTIRVKAWDTYNNSGEGYTEFMVASSSEMALRNVLNYPNPFTTHTRFQFEHNFAGQTLEVQVQIFTVSGRLLKTINQTLVPEGFRVTDIEWDGLDDFGDRIARGVYVYKVTVRADNADGESVQESAFQKLVILR